VNVNILGLVELVTPVNSLVKMVVLLLWMVNVTNVPVQDHGPALIVPCAVTTNCVITTVLLWTLLRATLVTVWPLGLAITVKHAPTTVTITVHQCSMVNVTNALVLVHS